MDGFRRDAGRIFRFGTLRVARDFRDRAGRAMLILLGDDGRYWVCDGRVASDLRGMGYEVLE